MSGIFSKSALAALAIMALSGCHSDLGEPLQSGQVMAIAGAEGRWTGTLHATTNACPGGQQALMSIGVDGAFAIDPFASTLVIRGKRDPDGHYRGVLHRVDPNGQTLSLTFEGLAVDTSSHASAILGTIETGPCRWSVTLHRG